MRSFLALSLDGAFSFRSLPCRAAFQKNLMKKSPLRNMLYFSNA